MEEVPRKREGGGGVIEGCVDCYCEEGGEKGGEGEHDEGQRPKSTVVISGGFERNWERGRLTCGGSGAQGRGRGKTRRREK